MTIRLSRIAWLLALSTVLTGLCGVAATYLIAKKEYRELLDHDLETQSRLLSELLAADNESVSNGKLGRLLKEVFDDDSDEDTLWVNVYNLESGRLASNLRHELKPQHEDNRALSLEFDGHAWHGLQRRRGPLIVQVLRRDDYLEHAREEVFEDIATPVLAAGAINLLLLAVFIAMALVPVSRLGRQLETRNADSLTPLSIRTSTREVAVLRDTINRLIGSVDKVLQRERQFASDVAHELRTPLTTLRLELASDEPDLDTLSFEVERLTRLVSQMLTLARVERGHLRERFESLRLDALCAAEIGYLDAELEAAQVTVHKTLAAANVRGDEVLLAALIRNLVHNVVRHAGPATTMVVTVDQAAGAVRLSIEDSGPGIAPAERQRLNTGFSRLDSRSPGLGLGLAICRKIAEVHGASIMLMPRKNGESGLLVAVAFPAEPAQ